MLAIKIKLFDWIGIFNIVIICIQINCNNWGFISVLSIPQLRKYLIDNCSICGTLTALMLLP